MELLWEIFNSVFSTSQGICAWVCQFIECQLDFLYLGWLLTLLKPTLLTIFILPLVILLMLYFSALFLYLYTKRWNKVQEVIQESRHDPWKSGRYLVSLLWDAHGSIWHGYDVQGLENINLPPRKGGLIVYYHGALPVDIYYLVSRLVTSMDKQIHLVGDRFLQKIPGWNSILEAFNIAPGSVTECVRIVSQGNLLAVSPGGVREAQFSDHSYALVWGSRLGFAKVALQANCPIIPMFTKNLREAFRTVTFPFAFWNFLYSRFKLPFAPIYGGFPVKLVSILGPCIYPEPGETADHLAHRVECALYSIIRDNQRLPGNILAALLDRFSPSLAPALMGPGSGIGRHHPMYRLMDSVSDDTLSSRETSSTSETEGNMSVESIPVADVSGESNVAVNENEERFGTSVQESETILGYEDNVVETSLDLVNEETVDQSLTKNKHASSESFTNVGDPLPVTAAENETVVQGDSAGSLKVEQYSDISPGLTFDVSRDGSLRSKSEPEIFRLLSCDEQSSHESNLRDNVCCSNVEPLNDDTCLQNKEELVPQLCSLVASALPLDGIGEPAESGSADCNSGSAVHAITSALTEAMMAESRSCDSEENFPKLEDFVCGSSSSSDNEKVSPTVQPLKQPLLPEVVSVSKKPGQDAATNSGRESNSDASDCCGSSSSSFEFLETTKF